VVLLHGLKNYLKIVIGRNVIIFVVQRNYFQVYLTKFLDFNKIVFFGVAEERIEIIKVFYVNNFVFLLIF